MVDVPCVMLNWFDWARMASRSLESWTRLTRKLLPGAGHPPLGVFMEAVPRVPSTDVARTSDWKPVMFWHLFATWVWRVSGEYSTSTDLVGEYDGKVQPVGVYACPSKAENKGRVNMHV
jgi:hypothetical protein